jgi:glycerol-3-phosphate acyltransferase PlsY
MNEYLIYLLCLLLGYLTGSILFSYIFTKIATGKDIRTVGNYNAGAANTYKHAGLVWGVLAGILDGLKAFIPILIGSHWLHLSTVSLGLIGIGAIIGHCSPLYFRFKGGRGAATLMGIYLFFIPTELLISFVVVPLIVYITIKKHVMGWNPAGIVALSAVLSLFFDNPSEVKTIVWVSALIVLFYNRDFVPKIMTQLIPKKKTSDQ